MTLDNAYQLNICTVNQLYTLRKDILRPDADSMQSVHFDGDNDSDTIHIALFKDKEVIGCLSVMSRSNSLFLESNQYQMRGMAVNQCYQHCGYGKQMIEYGEKMAILQGAERIWLNARIDVVDFYVKQGYVTVGEPFDIPNVCKHIVMSKLLPKPTLIVRPYEEKDKDFVRQICIKTAYPVFKPKYHKCLTLLYSDYYTENEKADCYVLDNNGVAIGYILCSTNSNFKQAIKPYLHQAYRSQFFFALIVHIGMRMQNKYHAQYKSHMHIDIMPTYQRMGYGSKLVDTLLTHLSNIGIPSLSLCARADNQKAINFYTRYGFTPIKTRFGDTAFYVMTNKE